MRATAGPGAEPQSLEAISLGVSNLSRSDFQECSAPLTVAFVNLMPQLSSETTLRRFAQLIGPRLGSRPIRWRRYGLFCPQLPTSTLYGGEQPLSRLWTERPDAVVVSGAEPQALELTDEPCWPELTRLFDFCVKLNLPTMLSCLAAHAGVLYFDGVRRVTLSSKCAGVFDHEVAAANHLTADLPSRVRIPHSRWNEVEPGQLQRSGYQLLASSRQAGAGMFAKGSFLFCQAHPEYDVSTLLKEYRRDVGRYLDGSQPAYPTEPAPYFSPDAVRVLAQFRNDVEQALDPTMRAHFPYDRLRAELDGSWHLATASVVRRWLMSAGEQASCSAPRSPAELATVGEIRASWTDSAGHQGANLERLKPGVLLPRISE